jgi:subtilisin-like proprotein convertase family protein
MTQAKLLIASAALLATAGASAGTSTASGGPIPDFPLISPLTLNFSVTETGPLAMVDLTLTGLAHTWAGDLLITLASPNGTVASIMRRPQANNGDPALTVGDDTWFGGSYRFIDSGASLGVALAGPIGSVAPSGDYQASIRTVPGFNVPVLLNATFANTSVFGTWTLQVFDLGGGGTGSLGSASLNVSVVPEPGTYALMMLGLVGLTAAARLRKLQA